MPKGRSDEEDCGFVRDGKRWRGVVERGRWLWWLRVKRERFGGLVWEVRRREKRVGTADGMASLERVYIVVKSRFRYSKKEVDGLEDGNTNHCIIQ